MSVLKEFKDFAVKGNVVDMAVGIIVGASFGTIVSSLVADVLMPPIGLLMGRVDFSNLFFTLKEGLTVAGPYSSVATAKAAGAVTINYGQFLNQIISFVIVAFAVFILVHNINKLKKQPVAAAPNNKKCPYCATDIPLTAVRCPNCTSELKA